MTRAIVPALWDLSRRDGNVAPVFAHVVRRAVVAFWLAALLFVQPAFAAGTAPADLMYARPGRLVDVGGFRINLRCYGTGSPTVIFDAGLGDWSPAWATVQPVIARRTRTCSFDRAGSGFSDVGPLPRTSSRIVDDLHTALQHAGERAPYVLVAHSFGSLNLRLYADRYLSQVAGIVLVDGSHEDQQSLTDVPSMRDFERQLAVCERLGSGGFHGTAIQAATCDGLYFRGLPERRFSAELNRALERQALAAKQAQSTLSEAMNMGTLSSDEVRAAKRSYGNIPLRVLTATDHRDPSSHETAAYWRHWEATWHALHDTWLPLSTDSKETMAPGSSHYIQFDRTALVIRTIEDVIGDVRTKAAT